jgi:hypothetical protein
MLIVVEAIAANDRLNFMKKAFWELSRMDFFGVAAATVVAVVARPPAPSIAVRVPQDVGAITRSSKIVKYLEGSNCPILPRVVPFFTLVTPKGKRVVLILGLQ